MKTRHIALLLGLFMVFAKPAAALDLLQAWQAASQHDPELAAAHAAFDAGQTRREQANSLWRPNIHLSATAGVAHNETQTRGAQFAAPGMGTSPDVSFDTSVRHGTMTEYAITAKQPLYDPKRKAQSQQLKLSADMATTDWDAARQQLILRTAEHYFNVLIAEESLDLLRQQQTALQRMQDQTRVRFDSGDAPIIDVHEADARIQAVQAQVLLAEVDLQIQQEAFKNLTGLSALGIAKLRLDNKVLETAAEGSVDSWLERAAQFNLGLQKQGLAQSVAQEEANKHKPSSAPALDLVGSAGRTRLQGSGKYGDGYNNSNNWMVGVQLSIPLYTGGYRSARYQEALHQRDQARLEGRAARLKVEQMTRAAWLSLSTGQRRINALRLALVASKSRLDATHLGLSVGDRTVLDLLDAENAVTQSSLALVQTMANLALDRLRLESAAGALNEASLQPINCVLEGGGC